jgi:hypothetical protein
MVKATNGSARSSARDAEPRNDSPSSSSSERRERTQALASAWIDAQAAAAKPLTSTLRGYDPRYERPDITHERALAEACAAAALVESSQQGD